MYIAFLALFVREHFSTVHQLFNFLFGILNFLELFVSFVLGLFIVITIYCDFCVLLKSI